MSNTELVQSVYEAFANGNIPVVLQAFDANIEWYEAENSPFDKGVPFMGGQNILAGVFGPLAEDFETFQVKHEQFVESGNLVVMLGRYVGKTKKGKNLNAQAVHAWTVENGKIAKFVQYTDTAQWQNVME